MLQLNEREWADFLLTDYFEIAKGNQNNMAELQIGAMPLISAKKIDNGCKGFFAANSKPIFKGHCLTINNDGDGGAGISYYQPADMLLDTHVTALYPRVPMTAEIMRFIAACITVQREKFGHGYSLNNARLAVFRMMLPVDDNGQPDYAFMEEYIKEREQQLIQKYIAHIRNTSVTIGGGGITPLHEKDWRCFVLGDLFTLIPGKGKGANHLKTARQGGISYLGATNRNNAVLDFVEPVEGMVQKGNCIAFIRNGEGSMGYAVYKQEYFISTADITLGYAPFLNMYVGFFITTVADKVRGKYVYNYKRSDTRLRKELLLLPVDSDGQPDWRYMEQYTKMLMAKVKLQYLQTRQTQ